MIQKVPDTITKCVKCGEDAKRTVEAHASTPNAWVV